MKTKWILMSLAVWAVGGASATALAYIPGYAMIMSRTAENHGRTGYYELQQELTYQKNGQTFNLREVWTVHDDDHMKVHFYGLGPLKEVDGTYIYRHKTRFYPDGHGRFRSSRTGADWMEAFFYFQYSKRFKPRVVQLKIAPPASLQERPKIEIKDATTPPQYPPEDYVRLTRLDGHVNYTISTNFSEDGPIPGLWIGQDEFLVRKVRFADGNSVTADDFGKYYGDFYFPKKRVYQWDGQTVTARLISMKYLGRKLKTQILEPKTLDGLKAPQWDESGTLKDFYTRFR